VRGRRQEDVVEEILILEIAVVRVRVHEQTLAVRVPEDACLHDLAVGAVRIGLLVDAVPAPTIEAERIPVVE
jgi:hypothetical protein